MGVSRILRIFFNIRLATSIPECQVVGESDADMHEVLGTEEDPIYDFFFSDDTVRPGNSVYVCTSKYTEWCIL